ncbi:MAG: hypothetical protein Q8M24_20660 [Pseudolabrys sp.]|nr:hypothetical protein [Pseudolabrys sp.]MDP2297864.1 hypothetical protein [Pseudolabrys sp.]
MQQPVHGRTTKDIARVRQQQRYHAEDKQSQAHRDADFARRQRTAGLDREPEDEDIDAFRYRLARILTMFVNDWEGCPLRLCRRMQGCMAPESKCANHAGDPPMTQEEWQARWEVARLEWRRALDAMIEAAGRREAFEAAAERERALAFRRA